MTPQERADLAPFRGMIYAAAISLPVWGVLAALVLLLLARG